MTNPAAGRGAGCQQSKVSIIYHLLKDTAFCSHAERRVKHLLIPPACGLAEAAPALPSAGAGLGAGASLCDSWPCRHLALQEQTEPPGNVADSALSPSQVNPNCQEKGYEPPRRLGQGWGIHSRHCLAPQLPKSWFSQGEQGAVGAACCCRAARLWWDPGRGPCLGYAQVLLLRFSYCSRTSCGLQK